MMSSGVPISARAAATRCCWPTESSVALRLRRLEAHQQAYRGNGEHEEG